MLLSSFAAGAIVKHHGLHVPFLLAAGGFVLTALLDQLRAQSTQATPPRDDAEDGQ